MSESDFETGCLITKCRFSVTIEKVPAPRWPAVKRFARLVLRGNWRGAAAAWQVVRTGRDIPYRGVVYNAGVGDE